MITNPVYDASTHPHSPRPEWSPKSRPLADHVAHPHDRLKPARRAQRLPEDMVRRRQWVTWRYLPPTKPGGKPRKVPFTPGTHHEGKANTPDTWGTYSDACADVAAGRADGIGYVFTADDPFFCIDFDDCRDPETGVIDPWVQAIINRFGTYCEPSPSGTGIHLVGQGTKPGTKCRNGEQIECYDRLRFLTITEQGTTPVRDCQDVLNVWYAETWPDRPTAPRPASEWSGVGMTNDEILTIAFRARNGEKIRRLYNGDTSGYPASQTDAGFSNEADQAFVNLLCGYTDDDDQLADLWRTSGLYRKKLDRSDYVRRTIETARRDQTWRYNPNHNAEDRRPHLSLVPPADTSDLHGKTHDELLAIIAAQNMQLALAYAFILRQGEAIHTLRERVRRADEREAVYKNTGLGSARNVGAVLGGVLETLTPQEPDSPTPIRLYLDRLADETNQSPETCSRQLKGLATYKGPDGAPVVRAVTRKIPRKVDPATGEVTGPSKEIWVGLSCEPSELTRILASLEPDNAPQHGGATDRGVCPEHPNAGVIRRERTTKHIDHVCAHCKKVVDVETITGPTTAMYLDRVGGVPVLHDADQDDDWVPEPFAHRPHENVFPVLHDADQDAGVNLTPPPHLQHARTTDNHTFLICKMKVRDHEKNVAITGVQPPDIFEESPEPETGMDPDPEPQAEVSAKPKAEHVVLPDPSWLWDRSPEPDAPNLCACGAPLPPGRKWTCAEGCDGTPKTTGRVSA